MRRVVGLCLACWACGGGDDASRGALVLADRIDSGAGAVELQERLLAPYLARHPGLALVRRPFVARDEYRTALLTALAGDEPPDVFLLDETASTKLFRDLAALTMKP